MSKQPKMEIVPVLSGADVTALAACITSREITDDMPADIIGEVLVECIRKVCKAGYDPVKDVTFHVIFQ